MNEAAPHFSVIIPTHNRQESLLRCIRYLAGQSYMRDRFEVIIVDDGSSPPVDRLKLPSPDILRLCVIRQDRKGAAVARNAGADCAQGRYLAFTDDDCCPHASWLQNLAQACDKSPDSAATGKTLNYLTVNLYASAAQLLIDYLYSYYNAVPQRARFLTSNNFAVPTALFRAIGGFHPAFPTAGGEDREFCDRWLSRHYSVVYSPDAVISHMHSMTLAGFIKQQFNYGRGAFHFNRLRSAREGTRFSIEPPAFYTRMFRYPFLHQKLLNAQFTALLFAVSQGANFAGFAYEKVAYSPKAQD